jgi:hypothetical protein
MSRGPRSLLALGVATISVVATACATGPRPTLVDVPTVTDTVAQAVLDRLERADGATFTADYEITPSITGQPTHATVLQSGGEQRVTIGDVEYYSNGTSSRTCTVGGTDCVDSIDEARISNLNVTSQFWGSSSASKLQVDSANAVDASQGRIDTIASRQATCADVFVAAPSDVGGVGSVTYCAVDDGILARYFGADVSIELTSFAPTVDPARLTG